MTEAVTTAGAGRKKRLSRTVVYGLYGLAVGLVIPVAGWMVDHYFLFGRLPAQVSLQLLTEIHRVTPIHYFIDSIPVILAVLAMLVGRKQEQVVYYSENLETLVDERTRELNEAKSQQDQILGSVDVGLFLLHGDMSISEQMSAMTPDLVPGIDTPDVQLDDLLAELVQEDRRKTIKQFLALLFRANLNDTTVDNLNPLKELVLSRDGGERYLRLDFYRRRVEGEIQQVLVTITDFTEQVTLNRAVEESERRSRASSRLVNLVLDVDPTMMADFLDSADEEFSSIMSMLQGAGNEPGPEIIADLFQAIHSIKGNAGLLGIEMIEMVGHATEDRLSELRGRTHLDALDLLPTIMGLRDLVNSVKRVKRIVESISVYYETFSASTRTNAELLCDFLEQSVQQVAHRMDRSLVVEVADGKDLPDIPDEYRKIIKDAITQMVRNAASHGIEPEDVRAQLGKPPEGQIHMAFDVDGSELAISIGDDGSGIPMDALRRKAVTTGRESEDKIASWSESQLINLIFEDDFSTTESADTMSGRGVGLGLVRTKIQNLGGRIDVHTRDGVGTTFRLVLPASGTLTKGPRL